MKLIIGSTAIKSHFPDFRRPNNLDFAMLWPDYPESNIDKIRKWYLPSVFVHKGLIASPDLCYTIKKAWNNHNPSDKHEADLLFLERKGCKLLPVYDRLNYLYENHS